VSFFIQIVFQFWLFELIILNNSALARFSFFYSIVSMTGVRVKNLIFEVTWNPSILLPRTEADCKYPVYIRQKRVVGGSEGHVS
jgi:hypothetical protein